MIKVFNNGEYIFLPPIKRWEGENRKTKKRTHTQKETKVANERL